jgi:spermidine synthase
MALKLLRKVLGGDNVEVSESAGVRSLHLGGDAIQSAMRLSAPDKLELHYTQAMLACLLFRPEPRDMLMIGLGGGSIAKYVRSTLPAVRMTVVEISAKVVAAARSFFDLPADDETLRVVVQDGAKYVAAIVGARAGKAARVDILLLDGFDDGAQAKPLCTAAFYQHAHDALREDGMLVVNFMAEDPKLDLYRSRIADTFNGRVVCMHAMDHVNVIVFAFRGDDTRIAWETLRKRARQLKGAHPNLPLEKFITLLRADNAHTANFLAIRGHWTA